MITYRDLTTLEEFAAVVQLERDIWGGAYDDVVPVSILATIPTGMIVSPRLPVSTVAEFIAQVEAGRWGPRDPRADPKQVMRID